MHENPNPGPIITQTHLNLLHLPNHQKQHHPPTMHALRPLFGLRKPSPPKMPDLQLTHNQYARSVPVIYITFASASNWSKNAMKRHRLLIVMISSQV